MDEVLLDKADINIGSHIGRMIDSESKLMMISSNDEGSHLLESAHTQLCEQGHKVDILLLSDSAKSKNYDAIIIEFNSAIIDEANIDHVRSMLEEKHKVVVLLPRPMSSTNIVDASESAASLVKRLYLAGFCKVMPEISLGAYRMMKFEFNDVDSTSTIEDYEREFSIASNALNLNATNNYVNTEFDDSNKKLLTMKQLILEKDKRIEELEASLSEYIQKYYVAQDAVVGAQAEKARADGVASELGFLISMKSQELSAMVEEVEAYEDAFVKMTGRPKDMRMHQSDKAEPKSLKQKLRQHKIGKKIADVTRPVRKKD